MNGVLNTSEKLAGSESSMEVEGRKHEEAPFVSVVMPVRNEAAYIAQCLDSVLANDYPPEWLEVLVLDGLSSDETRDIVLKYAQKCPNIRLIDNPKIIQAAAMNIGINEAKGDIIIRTDAHTIYSKDYISECVRLLQDGRAVSVGGAQRAIGRGYIAETIAVATTSPFGVGNAYFRFANREMYVDTVYLGAWYKSVLQAAGGFDYEWAVNEDYELNYRLREMGGKILLSPRIRCWYYVRGSLQRLARQYIRYGFWKVKTLVTHPNSLAWRQLVPPAFVVLLLVSLGLSFIFWQPGTIVLGIYLSANILASLLTSFKHGLKYVFLLPVVFATIHLCWGLGFVAGLFRWGVPGVVPKRDLSSKRL